MNLNGFNVCMPHVVVIADGQTLVIFSDGQHMAKRINEQIKSINKRLHKTIAEYNNLPQFGSKPLQPKNITFTDVIREDWHVHGDTSDNDIGTVPALIRKKAIDAYYLCERANEEKSIVQLEMTDMLKFLRKQHDIVISSISNLQDDHSPFALGAKALLVKRGLALECELRNCSSKFCEYISSDSPVSLPLLETFNPYFRSINLQHYVISTVPILNEHDSDDDSNGDSENEIIDYDCDSVTDSQDDDHDDDNDDLAI